MDYLVVNTLNGEFVHATKGKMVLDALRQIDHEADFSIRECQEIENLPLGKYIRNGPALIIRIAYE